MDQQTLTSIFPKAVWTGGSSIHASIARWGILPFAFEDRRKVMAVLLARGFSGYVYRTIVKNCPDMEWLMSTEDFESLLMADYYRFLHGKGAVDTLKNLMNPLTGNIFHRVALLEKHKVVGGVRVWIKPHGPGELVIGWRFRLEEQKEASAKIRVNAQQLAASLETEMVVIKEFVAKEEKNKEFQFAPALLN